jgi:hypothetical protein
MRATLVKKAIVAVPIAGKVEFRIPFTDRYLREHRDDFETEEVRGYRTRLARRLQQAETPRPDKEGPARKPP